MRCAELDEEKRNDEKQRFRLEDERSQVERQLREKEVELQDALLNGKREKVELENVWKGIVAEKDQAGVFRNCRREKVH